MRTIANYLRQGSAAVRMLLVLTVILGVIYPLAITAIAQIPGLKSKADGSLLRDKGTVVGSSLLGQSFTDAKGDPILKYFQSRPSAGSYNPEASGATNLGPESVVDTLPNPKVKTDVGKQSLLTQVCSRSLAIGTTYGVSGARPFCTSTGVGAVLAVFWSGPGYHGTVTRAVSVNQECPAAPFVATYRGAKVTCATFGDDYAKGQIVPVRGTAPAHPAVPADAVTSSGSGLDPSISPGYAALQEAVVAKARGITVAQVRALVSTYTTGRGLGFMGEKTVNVLQLNLALDRKYPAGS